MFRFPGLPERLVLPPLDAHYISFTLAGSLVIERDLGRELERAGFRPGMSLILPAGRENASGAGTTAPTSCTCTSPRPGWARLRSARVAAPQLIERFAFRIRCSARWRER